jgi:hypothetical protein
MSSDKPEPLDNRANDYSGVATSALISHQTIYDETVDVEAVTSWYDLPLRMQEALNSLVSDDEADQVEAGFRQVFPNFRMDRGLSPVEGMTRTEYVNGRTSNYRQVLDELSSEEDLDADVLIACLFQRVFPPSNYTIDHPSDSELVEMLLSDSLERQAALQALTEMRPELGITERDLIDGNYLAPWLRQRMHEVLRHLH